MSVAEFYLHGGLSCDWRHSFEQHRLYAAGRACWCLRRVNAPNPFLCRSLTIQRLNRINNSPDGLRSPQRHARWHQDPTTIAANDSSAVSVSVTTNASNRARAGEFPHHSQRQHQRESAGQLPDHRHRRRAVRLHAARHRRHLARGRRPSSMSSSTPSTTAWRNSMKPCC